MPMSAPAWPYFSKAFKSSAGRMDATSESIIAGAMPTQSEFRHSQKSWSDCNPTYWSPIPRLRPKASCKRPAPYRSCSSRLPLGQGLVASLSHPGGNITGFSVFEFSLGTKWVEVLKQIAPGTRRVTAIFNPETAPYYGMYLRSIEAATSAIAVELIAVQVHSEDDISNIIRKVGSEPNGGLFVLPDSHNVVHRKRIIELSAQYRLPAIYYFRYFASDGGLISYGPDEMDLFVRTASYVGRILKGASASDLPVQQPTKFELVINLKTAKALGLNVPDRLLALANEVIE